MTAVASAEAGLKYPDRIFVDGAWTQPATTARVDVFDSTTEQLLYQVADAQEVDMSRAVSAARAAFDRGPWPQLSHHERAAFLEAFARAIATRGHQLSKIWSRQMGILNTLAHASVPGTAKTFSYYAGLADDFPFVERHTPSRGASAGLLVREPVGVVGAIIPWNAPMALISYKIAPALLAGCTVVLKASPEAPGEAYVMAEIADEIGLPPGVLNVVTAQREVSELLVRDPRVDKITFTGSTAAGRRIASLCGERIARCTLELGGKSAAIVLDDYDIGSAATALASQACYMSGQVCASLTRIVVGQARHDDLVEALSAEFAAVRVGSPFDPGSTMGPLVTGVQRDRVESYIASGIADGATLAVGGGRPQGLDRGFFIEPTVFGNVDNSSTIAQEEIFGPVLSVIKAADDRQAVDIANDSIFGLNASVFTNSAERAYETARQLRSGTVGHNGFRIDFGIGFGGFKQSGIGREGGREGLLPFLESKTVLLDGEPASLASPRGTS
jgi:acyl-CoA reductase-like NAD-dependent aldehyde dehydrogenase